jgi:hypothetical protein
MAVDQSKTFYIDSFPVTYSQIEQWYENYKSKTAKNLRRLPDPYFSEKCCWFIAGEIVKEFQKPLKEKLFDSAKKEDPYQGNMNQYAIKKADYWDDDNDLYGETDDVIKNTFKEMERKYKEEQEELKRKQEDDRLRKLNEELWKKQQKQYQPPSQTPKEDVPFEWRKILNIPQNVTITLDIIKKAYRKEAMKRHPDRGGSMAKMMELFKARDHACLTIGLEPNDHFNQ